MSERGVGRLVARAARPAISARSTSWAQAVAAVAVPVAPPVPNPSPVPVPVLGSRGPAPEAPFAPATPGRATHAAPEVGATVLPALAAPEVGPALRQVVPAAITVQPVPRVAARPAAPAAAARAALERSVEPAAARHDTTRTIEPLGAMPAAPLRILPASDADSGTAGRRGQAVPAAPPVVIGQISVNVAAPAVAADPFGGCRAHAAARAAVRGGGW
jgi:hypothetical protein